MTRLKRYRYVGPAEILARRSTPVGFVIADTRSTLDRWLNERQTTSLAEPATFVIDLHRTLRLAPRQSEHVACAAGQDVFAAGEVTFAVGDTGYIVQAVSNQSTGYCPDPDCWPAVAATLDRLGVPHPGVFTDAVTFRLCKACGERNIVRDKDFVCALCEGVLPLRWNFDSA
ncbi:hypothetical protein NCC78_11115 [Micromonospora phytophila]|uniref:hypothetical protein n=1 Tax=Micromonospora phytophila TaxID=709888 RepID=UPI00202DF576|nr:hypothetical protein [Micromonospora phytophila]MCM0675232.1 hypothetical protein [Micromonospora phytophila]